MMRYALSLLGGGMFAVGLFWLLAQLVAPPEQAPEKLDMSIAMTIVAAPQVAPEQAAPAPPPVEAVPQQAPAEPAPEPPAVAESTINLPEVELPEEPVEPVKKDTELAPEPQPTPQPEPRPQPAPQPEPQPAQEPPQQAAPAEPPTQSAFLSQIEAPAAEHESAPDAQATPSNEPVSVGQVAPTSRVNPTYPSRAQRRGMEGFVEVAFMIRRDGSVDSSTIRVTNAQPRRVFDDAAQSAISQWQFEPSDRLRNATQRIEFQLR